MQNKLKLSIIVPIYNAEKFIDRCMNSIYAQKIDSYEVILVNDGSKDNSLEICQKYANNDARITVVNKENGGAGSARNAGLEIAKGEYIAFPDVDDWFDADMYSDLLALSNDGKYDLIISGAKHYMPGKDGDLKFLHDTKCEEFAFESIEECRMNSYKVFPTSIIFDVPWNKLYKRSIIVDNKIKFTDLRRCQDAVFNLDFYNYISSAISTEKCYYNYIENTAASTNRKFPKNYVDISIYYYNYLKIILSNWGIYSGKLKEHYDSSMVLGVYGALYDYTYKNFNLKRKEKKLYMESVVKRDDLQNFLLEAFVRHDVKNIYTFFIKKDVKGIFKTCKKEYRKEKLRNNKFLTKIYRLIKR